jgi:hypothetical protein
MNAPGTRPTPGDGYARLLLGAMGVTLVLCGVAAVWFFRSAGPLGIPPGLLIAAWGLNLLYGCAYFDYAEIFPSPFGFPYVRVNRSKREMPPEDPEDEADGSDPRNGR